MTYLLTCQGSLLRQGEPAGIFRHAPVLAPGAPLRVLERDLSPATYFQRFLSKAASGEKWLLDTGPLRGFEASRSADGTVSLTRHRLSLTAAPDGETSLVPANGKPTQRFLPLAETDLATLRVLLGNRWLGEDDATPLPRAAIRLEADFALRMGETVFDLRQQLPFEASAAPLSLALLLDGWRPRLYRLYRPLVFYAASRSQLILEQLGLSLASLMRHGAYDGQILLLTDLPQGAAKALAGSAGVPVERLSVQSLATADRAAAVAAKFAILDRPEAMQFQPLLFVDPDTIFDRDTAPLFAAIARSDRMLALTEGFSPLRSAPSVGAGLLADDGVDPGEGRGFNTGALGIPNLHAHGALLRLIRRVVMARSMLVGRNSWTWIDQPSTNYVAVRFGGFDTEGMSAFARHGFPSVLANPQGARGLVHVWPPRGAQQKIDAMRAYLAALGAAAASE